VFLLLGKVQCVLLAKSSLKLTRPENQLISTFEDDTFLIGRFNPFVSVVGIDDVHASTLGDEQVLGSVSNYSFINSLEGRFIMFFIILLAIYLPTKVYQKREKLVLAMTNLKGLVRTKTKALRSFLITLFT